MRAAEREDVGDIVRLLSQDLRTHIPVELGPPLPEYYLSAFERIAADPSELLAVAELDGEVAGTFQMSFIPYLLWRGGTVAQVESVRVAEHLRGQGIGARMMQWAIDEARARECVRIQLTTNKSRTDAHRFYERIGFEKTHEGMKLILS